MKDASVVNKFIGLANKSDPLKHNPGALKTAINVDVDDSFNMRRRGGYILNISLTDITGSYSTKNRASAYVVDDGTLKNIGCNVDIESGFTGTYLWDDSNGSVFVYGDKKGLIENNKFTDLYHPICPSPKIKAINGSQPAGYYQVACAYKDSNGREGGIKSHPSIMLQDNQAINIEIEQITGYTVTVYISPVNGKYLYKAMETSSSNIVWDGPQHLLAAPANDRQLGSSSIPKNGNAIAYHQNQLFIADYIPEEGKSVVWFSKPFSYHWFNKSKDYFVINEKINNLIDIGNNLVITTDNAIYYYENGKIQQAANYGAPSGKPYSISEDGVYLLYANKGICKLNGFENLTLENHELPTSPSVFSAIIKQNGYGRFVNLLSNKTDAENIFRS